MNEGAQQLSAEIAKRRIPHEEAARRLGLTPNSGYVLRLVSGDRKPSLSLAAKIEQIYGVPMGAWERLTTSTIPA